MARRVNYLLLFAISLVACSDAGPPVVFHSVSQIQGQPEAWNGRSVRLRGKVVGLFAVPMLDSAAYELSDGSGTIHVISQSGLPVKGTQVVVLGTVANLVMIGSFTSGLVIRETSRL